MWRTTLVAAAILAPSGVAAQVSAVVVPYLNVRSKDNYTKVMINYRTPQDGSSLPAQAQLDKIFVGLKPRGDGSSMKGRNKELDAGKISMANNNEIDKGKPLDSGHFPWHVGINVDGEYFCSGALISGRHIVTVAHCVRDYTNFTITLGSIDRNSFETNVVVMTTDNKVAHQSYTDDKFAFDVALITLPVPIATNGNNIRPVSLPKRSDVLKTFAKEKAYLTGWGLSSDGSFPNAMLTRANLPIMELSECWKIYGDIVTFQTMCVSDPSVNTCFANDGSPLVYRDSDNTWSLLGLVSFRSDAGCTAGHPLGIMRITSVLAWLSDKTSISVRN